MRIVMMGTGTFAEPTFLKLLEAFPGEVVGLVTQPDRHVGRRSGSSRQTGVGMATIAKSHNVPVIQPENINSEEGISLLAALQPDLCVVAAYGQIFKVAVLDVPKLGFINVHASLLPKYRGAAPVAHAILNGESETGVTIFRITTGIDTGEILAKAKVIIGEHETTGELEARLAPLGAELIEDVVKRMKAGLVVGERQNSEQSTRAPKIAKTDGLIDWFQTTQQITRRLRAMKPFPSSYTYLHRLGKKPLRVIIDWAIDAWDNPPVPGVPGKMLNRSRSLMIRTGDGMLQVLMIQPAGKKAMGGSEFIQGYPLVEGSRFGPEVLS